MIAQTKSLSTKGKEYPIGRITLIGKGNEIHDSERKLVPLFADFVAKVPKGSRIKILITPAGFLKFKLPTLALNGVTVGAITQAQLQKIQSLASAKIDEYLSKVGKATLKKVGEVVDYLTIGIDGSGVDGRHNRTIELIAVYDVKAGKILHWTGKFYPSQIQARTLIRYPNISSHLLELDGTRVMILSCHDLNVFHPRGKSAITGWRAEAYREFITNAKKFKPQVAIQHPHTTEHTLVWARGWSGMMKALPSIRDYAGGIRAKGKSYLLYTIDEILDATKRGNIFEYRFKP